MNAAERCDLERGIFQLGEPLRYVGAHRESRGDAALRMPHQRRFRAVGPIDGDRAGGLLAERFEPTLLGRAVLVVDLQSLGDSVLPAGVDQPMCYRREVWTLQRQAPGNLSSGGVGAHGVFLPDRVGAPRRVAKSGLVRTSRFA